MKFKCNTYDCQYEFSINITEDELNKEMNYHAFDCPKCKDRSNGSYRIKVD